jgi:hypothetical protein
MTWGAWNGPAVLILMSLVCALWWAVGEAIGLLRASNVLRARADAEEGK